MDTNGFANEGYTIVPGVISSEECDCLIQQVEQLQLTGAGSRNVLAQPWCLQLADALKKCPRIASLLPHDVIAAQCTLFEKTARKNWAVTIHQDLGIPVRERIDSNVCTGWARKEGVLHTQPPAELLATLVAIRVHLDPCPLHAGPLRVVPGSHVYGRLPDSEAVRLRSQQGETDCVANRGDALVMRPLLLHSSPRIEGSGVRRVLHFLFGPRTLPYGLSWLTAV